METDGWRLPADETEKRPRTIKERCPKRFFGNFLHDIWIFPVWWFSPIWFSSSQNLLFKTAHESDLTAFSVAKYSTHHDSSFGIAWVNLLCSANLDDSIWSGTLLCYVGLCVQLCQEILEVVNKRQVCIMAFQLQLRQRFSRLVRKTLLDFLTEAARFNELSCSRLSAVLAHVGMLFIWPCFWSPWFFFLQPMPATPLLVVPTARCILPVFAVAKRRNILRAGRAAPAK